MEDLSGTTIDELEKRLSRLREELEDIEEERVYVLGQTGLHVSAGETKKYESEIGDLRARILEVEQAIDARKRNK